MVLDASALLALLFGEPGANRVSEALPLSCISALNFSEVVARFIRDGVDSVRVRQQLGHLPIEVVPFDREAALLAAELVPVTAHLGLSMADRACLALARQRGLTALTGDRAWGTVPGVDVELIR